MEKKEKRTTNIHTNLKEKKKSKTKGNKLEERNRKMDSDAKERKGN